MARLNVITLHSPFTCDIIVRLFSRIRVVFYIAYMFSTLFFIFFEMEMNDGWHFFLYPSEFRDALGTPKPSLEEGGVPNKCTCRSFIFSGFFPFSILLFFHALEFIPPFFLDRESYSVSLKPFRRKDLKYPS